MPAAAWASVSDVLRHSWRASKRNVEQLALDLYKAYQITKIAVTSGWTSQWDDLPTLEKLRDLENYMNYLLLDHYDELARYEMTGDSFQWNGIALVCVLRCNVSAMAELLSDETGEELSEEDLSELVEQEAIMSEKYVADYTQTDLYEALFCLTRKWNELKPSASLWTYIGLLEKQAKVFIMFSGADSQMDGGFGMRAPASDSKPNLRGKYFSSQSFVSDVSTILCRFKRTQANWNAVVPVRDLDATPSARGVDLFRAISGFKRWLAKESTTFKSASISQIKDTVRKLVLVVGEVERHSRPPGGITTDAATILDAGRSTMEASFWTGKMGMGLANSKSDLTDMFDRDKMGPHSSSITILKMFHQCILTRHDFPWWIYYVFLEKDLDLKGLARIASRPTPVIVQFMGVFLVMYRNASYKTDSVEAALVFWTILMVKNHGAVHVLLKRSRKLALLETLLNNWTSTENEDNPGATNDDEMVEVKG